MMVARFSYTPPGSCTSNESELTDPLITSSTGMDVTVSMAPSASSCVCEPSDETTTMACAWWTRLRSSGTTNVAAPRDAATSSDEAKSRERRRVIPTRALESHRHGMHYLDGLAFARDARHNPLAQCFHTGRNHHGQTPDPLCAPVCSLSAAHCQRR